MATSDHPTSLTQNSQNMVTLDIFERAAGRGDDWTGKLQLFGLNAQDVSGVKITERSMKFCNS